MTTKHAREGLFLGVMTLVLLGGTCLFPYRFPLRVFVVGASFEVGFNNTVSYLSYLVLLPVLVLLVSRVLPWSDQGPSSDPSRTLSRFDLAVAASVIGVHVLLFAAVYAYKGRFVFAEGLYFQSLLYRMTQGDIPYIDFSFYYGPLMLYPGYWLTRLLGLDAGYAVWFVTTYVVGLVFLYATLRLCLANAGAAVVWFAFLAFGLFNPLTGLNVTFTRYLFPSIVFVAVTGFIKAGGWKRGLLATVTLAAALMYSFEVAILSTGATLALLVAYAVSRRIWTALARGFRRVVPVQQSAQLSDGATPARSPGWLLSRGAVMVVLAVAACLTVFLLVDPSGKALRDYPEVARSYSGGAHNVPIYPHFPFLALVTVTVVGLSGFARVVLRPGHEALSPGALAYAALALIAQRAAFGAAEPSHFAYFGLPIFLVSLWVTAQWAEPRRARTILAGVLLVGIMLPMQYYHATEFLPFVAQRLRHSAQNQGAPPAGVPSRGALLEADLHAIVKRVGTNHPYVMYEMEYSSLPVYRELGLRYALYSTMLINARGHEGIRRAIDEARATRAIVLVRKQDLKDLERPRRSTGLLRALDTLTGAHTGGSDLSAILLRSRTRLTAPFLDFVQAEYVPLYERNGIVAFGPR